MSTENRPLHVVVVSQRVSLLHEISWTLEAVGVTVQTSDDFDAEALWRRYSVADFVIVDSQSILEPTNGIFAHNSENPIYRLFLYDSSASTDFATWFSAGAHDALRVPLSRGELLARIRAGARYLEFERRLQRQSLRSAVAGMYTRRGFLKKLERMASSDGQHGVQHALLVTAVDWYAGVRQVSGEAASNSVVHAAARAIKRVAGENSISAYLGDGQFATLLVGQSLSSARNAAEAIARDFASRESHHESLPRPGITSAVTAWSATTDSSSCLSDALESLRLAELSGGGRVLPAGEFADELARWNEEMTTGNPFANVVAQDIMAPFAACVADGEGEAELAEALFNAHVAMRPWVDREGRLTGLAMELTGSETLSDTGRETFTMSPVMPETVPHDATFPDIFEAFSSRGVDTLTVTANGRPLGYITREGFLSMIDPLDAASYAIESDANDDLSQLVVPS